MYKYEKRFSEHGVKTNLSKWRENKYGLLALLRNPPDWNEEAMAVILPITETRGIERGVVDRCKQALFTLDASARIPNNEREDFRAAVIAAIGNYGVSLTDRSAEAIKERTGVKCVEGQKATRVIGKLCQKYGVDRHARYNKVFADLSDALSPIEVNKKAVISVYPCDFLEMSNKDNNWSSCHCLHNGGYESGCLSYMNDGTTVIFYIVDGNVTDDYAKAPKRSRQVFCYAEGMLLQSRLYPNSGDEDAMRRYRNLVQGVIAACLDVPNRWTLKKNRLDFFKAVDGSRQYPDYNSYGTMSVLKDLEVQGHIIIGEHAYCVCCGQPLRNGNVKCGCDNKVVCQDCGNTVPAGNAT